MQSYTVIIAGGDCDTFVDTIKANTVKEAQLDILEKVADIWNEDPADLFIVAVFAGEHDNIQEFMLTGEDE